MRIALVIPQFDPARGGAEQWTWQYARCLLSQGHEVHVVASRFAAIEGSPKIVPHAVADVRFPCAWADAAAEVLRRVRADVVHDMGSGWCCDVFQPHGGSRTASFEQNLLLLPKWLRPMKRLAATALPRYREFRRLAERQYAHDGRRVIALSRMVAGHLRQYHNVPPDRMRLVYNGVDVDRFSPEACSPHRQPTRRRLGLRNETLLLIVAHNFRLKGVATLLQAVSRLHKSAQGGDACRSRSERALHLAVVGGKSPRSYQRLAHRLGIGGQVTFVGPQADVMPYYAAADLYVHPTFYDPCSLVVLEAMACGLPVVTSSFNGASELICGGSEGYVVDDPSDHRELAERIEPLLDAATRARKAINARRKAEAHSWERNCREMFAVYEELPRQRRKAA